MGYKENRIFGDKCLPQVSAILGQLFIIPAPEREDQKHNSDLMVLSSGDQRYGVRVRRWSAYKNELWREQFTIRYNRKSGYPTEFDKIVFNKWGDVFVYGFADADEKYLIKWTVLDLDVFRVYAWKQMQIDKDDFINRHLQANADPDDSEFLVFNISEIPGIVLASSDSWRGWGNVRNHGR